MKDKKEELNEETTKKEIINSVLQPAAQVIGTTLAIPFEAINAKLANVRRWINNCEYSLKVESILQTQLLENLKGLSSEKISTPDRFIIIPLIKNLDYIIDDEVICQLYTSLLSTNMNLDTKNMAHPSFIHIIEQLSPLDAKVINFVGYLNTYQPLIRIFACDEEPKQDERMIDYDMPEFGNAKKKIPLFSHYSAPINGLETTPNERAFVIQNLNRLGLINIDYREHIIDAKEYKPLYDNLLASSLYHDFVENVKQKNLNLKLTDGYTSPTDYGRLFFSLCCNKMF